MVGRYRRGKQKKNLLGNHQRCWLWGRHVVLETLRAGKWRPHEVFLSENLTDAESAEARSLADAASVPLAIESADQLRKRCRSGEHQGYVSKMPEFPYDDVETALSRRTAEPLYVLLDAIQDPYNLGAILRSAEALAVTAVFLPAAGQVGVTSLVARTSAGAVNHVAVVRTELVALAERLDHDGVQLVAAVPGAEKSLGDCDFRPPTAVVIGNEGTGLSPPILNRCNTHAGIPQSGRVGSLNAAVAASILLYEITRQRGAAGPSLRQAESD